MMMGKCGFRYFSKLFILGIVNITTLLLTAQSALATDYNISISTSGLVDISTQQGLTNIGSSDIDITSTCKAGYTMTLSTSVSDNNLYRNGDSNNSEVGTFFAPSDGINTLVNSPNTWGYSLSILSGESNPVLAPPTSNDVFYPVPNSLSTPATIKTPEETAEETIIHDQFPIYYGVSTGQSISKGTYKLINDSSTNTSGGIKYIVTANPACANMLDVSFNKNLDGAGSEEDDGTVITDFPTSSDNTLDTANNTLTLSNKYPKRTDYIFIEWNTSADGSGANYRPGSVISIGSSEGELTGNITLYAIWEPDLSATLINSIDFNKTLKTLSGMTGHSETTPNNTITAIMKSPTPAPSGTTTAIISSEDSETEIVAWYDNGTIYYYTLANNIYTATSCYRMFAKFQALTESDLFTKLNTSNTTNMKQMFDGVTSLTSLDLSHFDTSNVTDMESMFWGDTNLETLNVSNFNTSKVTTMYQMFYNVGALQLDVSNFNTENVVTMQQMFYGMTRLKSLDLSKFNTPKLDNMYQMFNRDSSLENITFGRNFNTSKVTTMQSTFDGCSKITTLDLSYFDTGSVTNMRAMFYGMTNLTTIYVSEDFDRSKVTYSGAMFQNDNNLVGELGTRLSTTGNVIDMTYAQIDNATHNGYFTYRDISVEYSQVDITLPTGVNKITFANSEYGNQEVTSSGTINLVKNEPYTITAELSDLYEFGTWTIAEGGTIADLTQNPTTYTASDSTTLTLTVNELPAYDVTVILAEHATSVTFYNEITGTQTIATSGDTASLREGLIYNISTQIPTGYQFTSWSTTENGALGSATTLQTTYTVTGTATLTLAIEEKETPELNIIFNQNLDGAGSEEDDGTVVSNFPTSSDNIIDIENSTLTLSAKYPTRTGHAFIEWNTSADGTGTSYAPGSIIPIGTSEGQLSGDVTLYAIWTQSLSSTLINGVDLNKTMKTLSGMSGHGETTVNNTITAIKKSTTEAPEGATTAIVSEPNSETDITMWYDDGTIYYYTLANNIYTGSNCYRMFAKFHALTEIDLLTQINTSNATTMKQMFDGTINLTSLDLSRFDTSNVSNMESMFWGDSKLNYLNVSSFDTSSVTTMYQMFYGVGVEQLNLSSFNTENVTTMYQMFYGMTNIKSLDLSSFNTPKLNNMYQMFNRDSNLESITFGSNFNTSNVWNMQSVFDNCSKITTLDLSTFDTSNVTNMSAMFYGMTNLTTIYVSEDFNRAKVTNSNAMFQNDNTLVGGLGTRLSTTGNVTDMTYAQIDNALHNGYFTDINSTVNPEPTNTTEPENTDSSSQASTNNNINQDSTSSATNSQNATSGYSSPLGVTKKHATEEYVQKNATSHGVAVEVGAAVMASIAAATGLNLIALAKRRQKEEQENK